MERQQKNKLSSLSDEEIRMMLETVDFDSETDGEADEQDDLDNDDDVDDPDFLQNDDINMAIDRIVGMSESDLVAEIGGGESASLLLSPCTSSSIVSSTPRPQKRKRLQHEDNILNSVGEFNGSAVDIDPKSDIFKKMLWRQKNIVVDKSEIEFCDSELGEDFKKLDTPYKCFEYFMDDTIIEHIVEQTNIYAAQKNIATSFSTKKLEIKQYIGILIFMSVYRYPSVRSYWSEYAFQMIQNTMSRNRFEQIRSNIHFNDNSNIAPKNSPDHDPLYKIRPIVKHFNEKFKSVPMTQRICVDEQMCSTKMKTFLRQYMPDKPHKWGIKLFVLADSFGFCYRFEVYCGAGDNVVEPGTPDLGASSNVVVRLSRIVPEFKNHIMYFDNYYTSLPLLVYLRSRGIFSLGTIRCNRIANCKLPTDYELKKQSRGYSSEFCGSAFGVDISTTVWKDNKAVRLASTYVGIKPFENQTDLKSTVPRFVRSEKKYIDIPCPNIIHEYNSHMGGVDLMDGLIGRYKIPVKSNKYTNRLFTHLVDVAMVNAYILFKRINITDPNDKKYQLPNFRAEVAQVLCTSQNPTAPKAAGRPRFDSIKKGTGSKTFMPPPDVRYDGIEHFPKFLDRNGKKTCKFPGCTSETQIICRKCNINLCFSNSKDCFYNFHHK